jgi:hypothetical protein
VGDDAAGVGDLAGGVHGEPKGFPCQDVRGTRTWLALSRWNRDRERDREHGGSVALF